MAEPAVGGVEQRVRAAWSDVLDADAASIDESASFVGAGGHSLAAARIIARLRSELGVEIPLSALLRDDPDLAGFAATVAEQASAVAPAPAPPPAAVAATPMRQPALPLAPTMRRIWTWHQLYPTSPAYNVVRTVRIEGRIRPAALRAATADLAARHEALRCSVYQAKPGEPWIRVGEPVPVPVSVQVLSTTDDPMTAVDEALYRIAAEPLPLDTAPLWRLGVVYVPALGCTFLVLVIHHVISDLRSSDQLLRELAACYEARVAGQANTFAGPAPSLLDHVEHELAVAGSPAWQRDLEWWWQQLGYVDTAGTAPLPFPAAERDERVHAAETSTVDLEASASIDSALRGGRITPAVFFLTAATAVVRAWAGGGPETVGIPSVRVTRPDDHHVVGFLLDTLPLRIAAGRDERFDEACARTREAYTDAADHALPAFDEIVDRLRLPRATGARSPLIRLWFSDMTQADMPELFGELACAEYDLPPAWSLFELGVYLRRNGRNSYRLHLVVPRDVYAAGDISALLAQIVGLAERAAADPSRTIGELLAPAAPAETVGAARQYDGGILAGLARHADERPTATALADATGALDYRTLHQLVEAEAATLFATAGPRSVVALPARRDRQFVVRLLACRRAGVTAVLVDTAWPDLRRHRALEIAGVTHAYPSTGDGPAGATGRMTPGDDPGPGHVLFTSGTTGDPLAVRVRADVADAAVADMVELLDVTAADRVSMLSGAAHDPVLRDIGLALLTGATVCVPAPETPGNPGIVAAWMRRERISVVDATPALLGLALATDEEPLPALRAVVCGGSVLSTRTAALIRARAPHALVVNGYGCTETPQLVTAHLLAADGELPGTVHVPIGRQLPGRRVELRAGDGRACDVGQLGELWVAAPHIAEGYLASSAPPRFVTDPAGVRWVRTGDLCRRDSAGLIHLAGRADRQVLLAGHRVTLDEIENAARGCAGVADALAQVVGDGDGRAARVWAQRLPGYALAAGCVRAHLETVLPSGAVPARVLVVDQLDLGVNLKPVAPAGDAVSSADVDADLKRLAESMIGRTLDPATNFFDAGFTSVSLVQLSAELAELLGRPVEALSVFQHPNLGALGAFLDKPKDEPAPRRPVVGPGDGAARMHDRRREIRARIRESMPGNPAGRA
jgi:non-ribosomal peptide synthetase component F/acyl carrier protein